MWLCAVVALYCRCTVRMIVSPCVRQGSMGDLHFLSILLFDMRYKLLKEMQAQTDVYLSVETVVSLQYAIFLASGIWHIEWLGESVVDILSEELQIVNVLSLIREYCHNY